MKKAPSTFPYFKILKKQPIAAPQKVTQGATILEPRQPQNINQKKTIKPKYMKLKIFSQNLIEVRTTSCLTDLLFFEAHIFLLLSG